MNPLACHPIAVLRSPFRDKFGIPRQPGLIPEVQGRLEFLPPYDRPEAVAGLEGYSHVWLLWVFHQALREDWRPMVRPPRLGGNRKVGVFASRAPYRPNPIGLSAARLEGIEAGPQGVTLILGGVDLVDGTPVLDVKPYLPYTDAIVEARGGFAQTPPAPTLAVRFTAAARAQLAARPDGATLERLIVRLLELDPRPAYADDPTREYAFALYDFDLRWRVEGQGAEVLGLIPRAR